MSGDRFHKMDFVGYFDVEVQPMPNGALPFEAKR
jgi:hypothetical protein